MFDLRIRGLVNENNDETKLLNMLLEEWKVIQNKLDKVGEFKFHVKNWAFTLTVAVIGGAYVAVKPWWLTLLGTFPPALFWALERRQEFLATLSGNRAQRIERAIERIMSRTISDELREQLRSVKRAPGLAEDIRAMTLSRRFFYSKQADTFAYSVLVALSIVATVGAYQRQGAALGEQSRPIHTAVASPIAVTLSTDRESDNAIIDPPETKLMFPNSRSERTSLRREYQQSLTIHSVGEFHLTLTPHEGE